MNQVEQIVYISNRPEILNETLLFVDHYMPWINKVLICAPQKIHGQFSTSTSHAVQLIAEEEFDLSNCEHALFNFLLRKTLIEYDSVDENFILSDDDYRPIVEVPKAFFIEDGRHHAYWFTSLSEWRSKKTSYDRALQNTRIIFKKDVDVPKAHSVHHPQIINKSLYSESMNWAIKEAPNLPLCEWSVYFNYNLKHHPEQFNQPKPFATINWPDYPNIWQPTVSPGTIYFENYYPHLYNKNDLYGHILSNELNAAIEKINSLNEFIVNYRIPYMTHTSKLKKWTLKAFNFSPKFKRKIILSMLGLKRPQFTYSLPRVS